MLTEVLEKVKTLARGKKAAVLTGYADAVRAVASGGKADPERVAEILDRADRTPEQFEADVEALVERIRLRAVADKAGEAERKRAEAQKRIEAMEKRLEQVVEEIKAEAAPFHAAVRQAEADAKAAAAAEEELRKTCPPDAPARAELAEAKQRAAKADAERHELRQKIRRFEAEVATLRQKVAAGANRFTQAGHSVHPDDPASLERAEMVLADAHERLKATEAETAAAVAAMEAATLKMGQP